MKRGRRREEEGGGGGRREEEGGGGRREEEGGQTPLVSAGRSCWLTETHRAVVLKLFSKMFPF